MASATELPPSTPRAPPSQKVGWTSTMIRARWVAVIPPRCHAPAGDPAHLRGRSRGRVAHTDAARSSHGAPLPYGGPRGPLRVVGGAVPAHLAHRHHHTGGHCAHPDRSRADPEGP